jgi:putative phosphoribosyl transferase
MHFKDRIDAGQRLATALEHLDRTDLIVLGLPRGGVPVAYEVASHLHAPLDVLIVRKLGTPGQRELAFGAVGEGGVRVINDDVVAMEGLSDLVISRVANEQNAEIERRHVVYRNGRAPLNLSGKTAVVVDDGLATGATARAACMVARKLGAAKVVLAVPTAPEGWEQGFVDVTDQRVSLFQSRDFGSVGYFYENFDPISDDTVKSLLAFSLHHQIDEEVVIGTGSHRAVRADVRSPLGAKGVVVFAHGSGSGRTSPRNTEVAEDLHLAGFATVLVDLLTEDDDRDRTFDIEFLAERLTDVVDWVKQHPLLGRLPVALYGASTGAAAAVTVAANDHDIRCVVSRGGRVDLAISQVENFVQPILLLVGSLDTVVLKLNRDFCESVGSQCTLHVVDGASHLFEEDGVLKQVAHQAIEYLTGHLR